VSGERNNIGLRTGEGKALREFCPLWKLIKTEITKNVSQMDLENASIQEEIEEIVNDMYRKIDEIKNQISVYYFE
jgi:hypothetical protein